ncbi:AAA family ATPase [Mucilaginibacter flavidus]|uniref:AbiJ-related protein n=1 Tax=Mucilaginibacter flavidus TaxID=2949309 RepID=UPI0020936DD9|nr:AAA family ATPase [Mucilaginibacter flavidus]MCO5950579.1 AAA family ATPase [Mucilaginibacter flavidus]
MEQLSEQIKLKILQAILAQPDFLGVYSNRDEGIIDFLNLIRPLKDLPSEDSRYNDAEGDAYQHLVNNNDWEYDYVFITRFNLIGQDEQLFIKFLEVVVSPGVRGDRGQVVRYVSLINQLLLQTQVILVLMSYSDGLPVYGVQTRQQVSDRPQDIPPNQIPFFHSQSTVNKTYPHFYLGHDKWDDYHHRTTFGLAFVESKFNTTKIGGVKIMKRDTLVTAEVLPDTFTALPEDFCSLGQEEEYYANMVSNFRDMYQSILLALRDVALYPKIQEAFEFDDVYKTSLIRFNEPEQLARTIRFRLGGYEPGDWYKFTYRYTLPYAKEPLDITFEFDTEDFVKHRVFALIGRNGAGKTQVLSTLANELSKTNPGNLYPRKPLYSKVFTVSYSIFDHFQIPESDAAFNYVYCGIKKPGGGFLTEEEIMERTLSQAEKISYKSVTAEWRSILSNFVPEDLLSEIFTGSSSRTLFQPQNFAAFYQKLSSGQNILVLIISEILAQIRYNSMILYDEPETHLHPNAITLLMNTIFDLVEQFDSYCILATHSPLVIQEILARNVIILERDQDVAYIRQMERESFGENLTVISEDVFGNRNIDKHHLSLIRSLVNENGNYESIAEMLASKNLPLNLNTRLYIKGLIKERDEES